jgi:hypothetical protein
MPSVCAKRRPGSPPGQGVGVGVGKETQRVSSVKGAEDLREVRVPAQCTAQEEEAEATREPDGYDPADHLRLHTRER